MRGTIFSRLSSKIIFVAKMGGGDTEMNPRLPSAVLADRSRNIPSFGI